MDKQQQFIEKVMQNMDVEMESYLENDSYETLQKIETYLNVLRAMREYEVQVSQIDMMKSMKDSNLLENLGDLGLEEIGRKFAQILNNQ